MGEIKTEVRTLLCQLTEEEYQAKSKELSRLIREKAALADAKAAETKHYNEEIAKTELQIQDVLPLVETGKEERNIECRIEYNTPSKGEKTIFRLDTMELLAVENMTDEEKADMFYNAVEESNEDEGVIQFPKPGKKAKAN